MVRTDKPLTQYIIDLEVPGAGVCRMKVEAWPVLGSDGTRALHLLVLENITSVIHRAAEKGAAFTGDARKTGEKD